MASKRPRDTLSQASEEAGGMVSELHQAVTTTQRRRVLQKLLHLSETMGSILVEGGVMRALCLQLGFVLNRPIVLDSEGDQIGMVCCAIDSLYRNCADAARQESITDIGEEMFQVLNKVWKKKRSSGKLTLLSIWRSFSACSQGAEILMKQHEFLPILNEVLDSETSSKAVKDETLGIIKNMSHYAPDYRLSMLEQLGTQLARQACLLLTDRSSERLSAIFRNLALTPSVRLAMAEHPGVLSALIKLCSKADCPPKIRRNVLCTLDSLSMETDSCMLLLLHGDGMILGVLLHFLTSSKDEVIRRRSARALRLLARDKAVPILLNSTNVMQCLFDAAVNDVSIDVRGEATTAFASCAAKMKAGMPIHAQVLRCLAQLARGPASESVAMAVKEQVQHPPNRPCIVNDAELLGALSDMSLRSSASTTSREHVSSAFEMLSRAETTRELLVIDPVLNALIQNTQTEGSTCRDAVSALLNLASAESTRKRLVTHTGLLQALIRYTAACQDAGDKESVKTTMLMLIPQL